MVILHKRRARPIASRAALPRALRQLQRYLLQGDERRPEVPQRQVRFALCEFGEADAELIGSISKSIGELAQCASVRARPANTYVHLVFSAAPEDGVLTRQTWRELITATLAQLRLDPGGWYAVGHGDRDHDHVHVVAGTIDPLTHKMAVVHRNGSRLARLAEELELSYGLRCTGENARTQAEKTQRRQRRAGAVRAAADLAASLQGLSAQLLTAQSWAQLQSLLTARRVRAEQRRRSLIFRRADGAWCRASAVHRRLSLTGLQRRLGELPPAAPPQPPAPAPGPERPQLRLSAKYDNAALRRLLSAAAPGTLITGSARTQARAAREAMRLRSAGGAASDLSFADPAVQAAFEHMLTTGRVLRAGEITAFAPAAPAAAQLYAARGAPGHGTAPDGRGQLRAQLLFRGYREGQDGELRRGGHRLQVLPGGGGLGLPDPRDDAVISDALQALAACHPGQVLLIRGTESLVRRVTASAGELGVVVRSAGGPRPRISCRRP